MEITNLTPPKQRGGRQPIYSDEFVADFQEAAIEDWQSDGETYDSDTAARARATILKNRLEAPARKRFATRVWEADNGKFVFAMHAVTKRERKNSNGNSSDN